jgi:hypothetical protein
MYLSAVVTEIFAAVLVLALWFFTDWNPAIALSAGAVLVVLFAYFWLPRAIALWVAIEYTTDVHNGERWATPSLGDGDRWTSPRP